jgi:hypothetical protein
MKIMKSVFNPIKPSIKLTNPNSINVTIFKYKNGIQMTFKKTTTLLMLLLPQLCFAKLQISVGTGYQHGSLIGAQAAYQVDANRYYLAAGLVGAALGYDRAIDSEMKHTLGFAVGSEQLTSEDGFAVLTYNYHAKGMTQPGWKLGLSLGTRREDSASFFGDSGKSTTQTAVSFDLAYRF